MTSSLAANGTSHRLEPEYQWDLTSKIVRVWQVSVLVAGLPVRGVNRSRFGTAQLIRFYSLPTTARSSRPNLFGSPLNVILRPEEARISLKVLRLTPARPNSFQLEARLITHFSKNRTQSRVTRLTSTDCLDVWSRICGSVATGGRLSNRDCVPVVNVQLPSAMTQSQMWLRFAVELTAECADCPQRSGTLCRCSIPKPMALAAGSNACSFLEAAAKPGTSRASEPSPRKSDTVNSWRELFPFFQLTTSQRLEPSTLTGWDSA